jgi:hypothetical protein
VKHNQVKKLVLLSSIATLVALGMMTLSILSPKPIYLVIAMSAGQGVAFLSLGLYLLAIALDLQSGGGAAYEATLETQQESAGEEPKPAP